MSDERFGGEFGDIYPAFPGSGAGNDEGEFVAKILTAASACSAGRRMPRRDRADS
jgi:hypothetical protein